MLNINIRLPVLVVWQHFLVDHATFEALIGEQPLVFGVFLTMFVDLKPHQNLENMCLISFQNWKKGNGASKCYSSLLTSVIRTRL